MALQDRVCRQGCLRPCAFLLAALGLLLRLYYYLRDPSIWFDEAAVMLNVLSQSYAGLLGPLEPVANGAPFFLWLEKFLVTGLGDRSWVWRLPALVASCLGVVVFVVVARRLLPPWGAVWATGLFAFSDRLLWHTAEVRPYTLDTLIAVGVVAAWLGTASWGPVKRLLLFTVLCPPLLCLSYPAVFVCAALALVLLPEVRDSGRVATWVCWGFYLGGLAITFSWLLAGPIRVQNLGERACHWGRDWVGQMPDWSHLPGALLWPFVSVFEVLRYDLRPTGGLLVVFAVVGAVWLVRNRGYRVAVLLLGPLAAVMAAACLHRYPCGCGRPILFLTPVAALLVGAAVPVILRRCWGAPGLCAPAPSGAWPRRWCAGVAGLSVLALGLAPIFVSLYRIVKPWPRPDARGAAAYVLTHRGSKDMVVINSWDQVYFYRHFDSRWQCPAARLRQRQAPEARYWVTLNTSMLDEQTGREGVIGKGPWNVCAEREFGQLLVLLLERGDRLPDPARETNCGNELSRRKCMGP
jgi:hypothetical protein